MPDPRKPSPTLDDFVNAHRRLVRPEDQDQNHKMLTLESTGRHILISFPPDLTNQELLDFISWLATGFRANLPPVERLGG